MHDQGDHVNTARPHTASRGRSAGAPRVAGRARRLTARVARRPAAWAGATLRRQAADPLRPTQRIRAARGLRWPVAQMLQSSRRRRPRRAGPPAGNAAGLLQRHAPDPGRRHRRGRVKSGEDRQAIRHQWIALAARQGRRRSQRAARSRGLPCSSATTEPNPADPTRIDLPSGPFHTVTILRTDPGAGGVTTGLRMTPDRHLRGASMDLNDYQKAGRRTAIYPEHHRVLYPALGRCWRQGEVAGSKIKKVLRDQEGDSAAHRSIRSGRIGRRALVRRRARGDLGLSLEEVAVANLGKLASRRSAAGWWRRRPPVVAGRRADWAPSSRRRGRAMPGVVSSPRRGSALEKRMQLDPGARLLLVDVLEVDVESQFGIAPEALIVLQLMVLIEEQCRPIQKSKVIDRTIKTQVELLMAARAIYRVGLALHPASSARPALTADAMFWSHTTNPLVVGQGRRCRNGERQADHKDR